MSKMIDSMRLSDGLEAIASSTSREVLNSPKKQERASTPFAEYMSKSKALDKLPERAQLAQANAIAKPHANLLKEQTQPIKYTPKYERANYKPVKSDTTEKSEVPIKLESKKQDEISSKTDETITKSQTPCANDQINTEKQQENLVASETAIEPQAAQTPVGAQLLAAALQPMNIGPQNAINEGEKAHPIDIKAINALSPKAALVEISANTPKEGENLDVDSHVDTQNGAAHIQVKESKIEPKAAEKIDTQKIVELLNNTPETVKQPLSLNEIPAAKIKEFAEHLDNKAEKFENSEAGVGKDTLSKLDAPLQNNAVQSLEHTHSGKHFQHNGQNDNFQSATIQNANAQYENAADVSTLEALPFHVKRMVAEDKNILEIRLDPLELGKIEIRLERGADDKMTAHIIADIAQTRDLLQKDSSALEKTLRDSGMNLDAGGMQFSLRQENQNANDQKQTPKLNASSALPLNSQMLEDIQHQPSLNTGSLAYNRLYRPGRMDLRI